MQNFAKTKILVTVAVAHIMRSIGFVVVIVHALQVDVNADSLIPFPIFEMPSMTKLECAGIVGC